MSNANVGTAYISLVPKLDGGTLGRLETQLGTRSTTTGERSGTGFSNGFGKVLRGIAGLAVVAQAGRAVADVFSQAFSNASAYEQLVGGVETLYKDSADRMMQYANNAYATSGMSANQFMEQATSFSAALITSLGGDTARAADYANMAMMDISDNANKMGTSIESIQMAYQGFARGQYQMLDNLKLGYGGTKSEMERLLADAEAISGVHYDISNYADVVEAIHTIQTEMDITGTTALEAAYTMEGSINMTKAAWQNFLTGLGSSDSDMATLAQNLLESFTNVIANGVPLIINIVSGMLTALPQMITTLIPVLTDGIIQIINMLPTWLPQLVNAAGQLFVGIAQALTQIVGVLLPMLPQLVTDVCAALLDNLGLLLEAALQLFMALVQGLVQMLPALIDALPQIIDMVVTFVLDNIPLLLVTAVQFFMAIVKAVPSIVGSLLIAVANVIGQIPGAILGFLGAIGTAASQLMQGLINGIANAKDAVVRKIRDICSGAVDAIKSFFGIRSPSRLMAQMGGYIGQGLALGIEDSTSDVVDAAQSMSQQAFAALDGVGYMDGGLAFAGAGPAVYNFNGITIEGTNLRPDEIMDAVVRYANRARMMGGR